MGLMLKSAIWGHSRSALHKITGSPESVLPVLDSLGTPRIARKVVESIILPDVAWGTWKLLSTVCTAGGDAEKTRAQLRPWVSDQRAFDLAVAALRGDRAALLRFLEQTRGTEENDVLDSRAFALAYLLDHAEDVDPAVFALHLNNDLIIFRSEALLPRLRGLIHQEWAERLLAEVVSPWRVTPISFCDVPLAAVARALVPTGDQITPIRLDEFRTHGLLRCLGHDGVRTAFCTALEHGWLTVVVRPHGAAYLLSVHLNKGTLPASLLTYPALDLGSGGMQSLIDGIADIDNLLVLMRHRAYHDEMIWRKAPGELFTPTPAQIESCLAALQWLGPEMAATTRFLRAYVENHEPKAIALLDQIAHDQ